MIQLIDIKKWWIEVDKVNFILISTLAIIGTILSLSLEDNYLFFNKHLIFSFSGILLMFFISSFDAKLIRRISLVSIIFVIIILILILFIDYEIKGSKRWLKIFSLSFQPSEFIKPFFLVLSAWFISQSINGRKFYLGILIILFLSICGLIILQPDFGMTVLLATSFFCQLFIAGLSMFLVFVSVMILICLGISSYYFFDHVQRRVLNFFNPTAESYQIDLSLQAFKSGGLFGKGPGQGILKEKIPDANTDFIFAVAGEELGFLFCSMIVLLILIIVVRLLLKLLKIQDPYKMIAILGLTSSFGIQSLINICSSLALIPTKGMTLPFISYGGSSMMSSAILFGFLLSLTKNTK